MSVARSKMRERRSSTRSEADLSGADVLVMAAAVADYRPTVTSLTKLKKEGESASISLVRNPDLLAEIGAVRAKAKLARPVLVGFALEASTREEASGDDSNDLALVAYARGKLAAKKCDFVVANEASDALGKGRRSRNDRQSSGGRGAFGDGKGGARRLNPRPRARLSPEKPRRGEAMTESHVRAHLSACPACRRHVRVTELACPFCGDALGDSFRAMVAPAPLTVRLSRAALLALGTGTLSLAAACGGATSGTPGDAGQAGQGDAQSSDVPDAARIRDSGDQGYRFDAAERSLVSPYLEQPPPAPPEDAGEPHCPVGAASVQDAPFIAPPYGLPP